jgi:hypothetical protein
MRFGLFIALLLCVSCTKKPDRIRASQVKPVSPVPADEKYSAKLENVKSEVKVRLSQKVAWNAGQEGQALSRSDAVSTGEESSCQLQFQDDTHLELREKTMIIVMETVQKTELSRTTLALPSGRVSGKVSSRDDKLVEIVIRTPKGWLRASNRKKVERAKQEGAKKTENESGQDDPVSFTAEISPGGQVKVSNQGLKLEFQTKEKTVEIEPEQTLLVESDQEEEKVEEFDLDALMESGVKLSELVEPPSEPKKKQSLIVMATKEVPKFEARQKRREVATRVDLFKILSPKSGVVVSEKRITIEGTLLGQLKVFEGKERLKADELGKFKLERELALGVNTFTFQVVGPGANQIRYESVEIIRN